MEVVFPFPKSGLLCKEIITLRLLPHVIKGHTFPYRSSSHLKDLIQQTWNKHYYHHVGRFITTQQRNVSANDQKFTTPAGNVSYLVGLYQVKVFPISFQSLFKVSTLLFSPDRQLLCQGEPVFVVHYLRHAEAFTCQQGKRAPHLWLLWH